VTKDLCGGGQWALLGIPELSPLARSYQGQHLGATLPPTEHGVAVRFRELADARWLDNMEVGVRLFFAGPMARRGRIEVLERQPR
jgi:hypothetical protein